MARPAAASRTGHDTQTLCVSVVGREASFSEQAARGAGVRAQNENVPVLKIEKQRKGKLENY